MTAARAPVETGGAVALLERAVAYLLGSLHLVPAGTLSAPTPCRGWDLRMLLLHLDDSLLAVHDAAAAQHVGLVGSTAATDDATADLAGRVRGRAGRLVGTCTEAWTEAWTGPDFPAPGGKASVPVEVGGWPLATGLVAAAGAVEAAVHGWDVAAACGRRRVIPPGLAQELLELAPLLVSRADRPARFAAPVELPSGVATAPGDRLVALLGRHPY